MQDLTEPILELVRLAATHLPPDVEAAGGGGCLAATHAAAALFQFAVDVDLEIPTGIPHHRMMRPRPGRHRFRGDGDIADRSVDGRYGLELTVPLLVDHQLVLWV